MAEWWISLGSAGQVFACIAIPATLMLLIQTILTLIGIGSDSDADVAVDSDADADIGAEIDGVEEVNLEMMREILNMFNKAL